MELATNQNDQLKLGNIVRVVGEVSLIAAGITDLEVLLPMALGLTLLQELINNPPRNIVNRLSSGEYQLAFSEGIDYIHGTFRRSLTEGAFTKDMYLLGKRVIEFSKNKQNNSIKESE